MEQKIVTCLMFSGQAEEAIRFYTSVFSPAEIEQIVHQENGMMFHATFLLKGQRLMAIDNHVDHHEFTPAMSLCVTCDTEEEIDRAFEQLSQSGKVLVPLGVYPFSKKFAWVEDRYGVSWQLSLS
ncbi:putative 3-demethylubiquinone-9 3-methyltransferase (glyoxalase superfamily) [Anoxybacillus voinovskiensis]|uniref:Putative 3-demethylubiquinone-9 3-methyltransferase (Glyoxalase superfamily) n=1 Tax=Anoxybacteroides voinovskiense TaxID=230470 RepID=A0A840DQQ1_9BACL|nr:VOC family protein [Anoxybacillus voinovskiensis]MBB4075461.1 putative 3-demethylubiquinone-9 3-methyltransferase (glyoxalase superfamily) [Anoxybacillus voinovskiensis]GGJ79495.1 VOC family protein [Anoxybacillus voinovskiensis]